MKFTGKLILGFAVSIMLLGVITSFSNEDGSLKTEETEKVEVIKELAPEEIEKAKHDEWIENQFSGWDGRHVKLSKAIEESLNNPKSYEHVETKHRLEGKDLVIYMTYRGENGFGAIMTETIQVKQSYETEKMTYINN